MSPVYQYRSKKHPVYKVFFAEAIKAMVNSPDVQVGARMNATKMTPDIRLPGSQL